MRNAYVKTLAEEGAKNEKIWGLVADIGAFTYDDFKEVCPDRFVNVGIAECNMVGMAAGLALEGKIPFIYTITPFVTARSLEPIRVDICYQNLNVKVVGCGAGFSYSTLGFTHHATDDIAFMRALPNMVILSPTDARESEKATRAALNHIGPVYLRLGGSGELPKISPENYDFQIGKAVQLREGKDLTIIGTGTILINALEVADKLKKEKGLETRVMNFHTIKPIDEESILKCAEETGRIFTLEEHSIIGGLGSAVAEVLAENQSGIYFKRIGVRDCFCKKYSTNHIDLEKFSNIATPCIINTINKSYGEKSRYREGCGTCFDCLGIEKREGE